MAGDEKQPQPHPGDDGRYGAGDGPVSLWSPDAPLPVFAELEGRSVALVDGNEYRALIALRDAVAQRGSTSAGPGVVGAGARGAPLRATFPMRATVLGVDVIAIPVGDYYRLAKPPGRDASRERSLRLSRLDKDAEVRQFFLDRIGTEDVDHIRRDAITRFGADRVPSRTTINRFVVRTRTDRLPNGGPDGR